MAHYKHARFLKLAFSQLVASVLALSLTRATVLHSCDDDQGSLQFPYTQKREVCFVVRTVAKHRFEALLLTLLSQLGEEVRKSRVYVVNTDGGQAGLQTVMARLAVFKSLYAPCDESAACLFTHFPDTNASYGYVETDMALDVLTSNVEAPCQYLLVTNGDNLYSNALLSDTLDARSAGHGLIAFDFVTHHPRQTDSGQRGYQRMNVRLARGSIDLGAFLLDFMIYRDGHRFMLGERAQLFAADWHFLEAVIKHYGDQLNVILLPDILLFHQ